MGEKVIHKLLCCCNCILRKSFQEMVYFFNLCGSNREEELSEKLLQATVTFIPLGFLLTHMSQFM